MNERLLPAAGHTTLVAKPCRSGARNTVARRVVCSMASRQRVTTPQGADGSRLVACCAEEVAVGSLLTKRAEQHLEHIVSRQQGPVGAAAKAEHLRDEFWGVAWQWDADNHMGGKKWHERNDEA